MKRRWSKKRHRRGRDDSFSLLFFIIFNFFIFLPHTNFKCYSQNHKFFPVCENFFFLSHLFGPKWMEKQKNTKFYSFLSSFWRSFWCRRKRQEHIIKYRTMELKIKWVVIRMYDDVWLLNNIREACRNVITIYEWSGERSRRRLLLTFSFQFVRN